MVNLQVLSTSRRGVRKGDIFVLQVPDLRYLFGRVVSTDAVWTRAEGAGPAILVYVYVHTAMDKSVPDTVVAGAPRLLLPPLSINRLPWSRGYFETIGHRELQADDLLETHCFRSPSTGLHHDERGNVLPGPVEPVGTFALDSYASLDDKISDRLGIPPAP